MHKFIVLTSFMGIMSASAIAADPPIVINDPEPPAYVRVCDAFGNGYFYIPGTETCLRISGYVWFQVGAERNSFDGRRTVIWKKRRETTTASDTWGNDTYTNSTRARVNIDARSDTEWGDLASRIRVQSTWGDNSDGNATIDQAWLRLGGLFMGYSESYWVNAYNTGPSNWGSHSWGGLAYGYQQRHLIGYTFNQNNFFVSVSAENDERDNWTPDFTAKAGIGFGPATFWLKGAYDESQDTFSAGVGFDADVGPGNFRVLAYWTGDTTDYGPNLGFDLSGSSVVGFPPLGDSHSLTPTWSVIASYGIQFAEDWYGSIGGQYSNDFHSQRDLLLDSSSAWSAETSLVWTPVENFSVRTEVTYTDFSGDASAPMRQDDYDYDRLTGFVRFQRDF